MTAKEQLLEAEKTLNQLRIDRLNMGAKMAIMKDDYENLERNINGIQATIHALKTIEIINP